MGPKTIIVDGYNAARNLPGFEGLSLAAEREAILQRLVARYRHTPHTLIVVFDGSGPAETRTALPGTARGQVVFSCAGETADAAIARICTSEQACGAAVEVVSDDAEVRASATSGGAQSVRIDALERDLHAPPRHLRKRFAHQLHIMAAWERDADEGYIESQRAARAKGNGKRAPKGRHR